eukprot:8937367-Alexandrium_andersonii.AAC.1
MRPFSRRPHQHGPRSDLENLREESHAVTVRRQHSGRSSSPLTGMSNSSNAPGGAPSPGHGST